MTVRSASTSLASASRLRSGVSRAVRVLVVAGGGGGGGGANGVRTGGGGGGGGIIDADQVVTLGVAYAVRIGAGGAANNMGNWSRFGDLTAINGGGNSGSLYITMATGPGSLGARNVSLFPHQGGNGGTGITVSSLIHSGGGGAGGGGGGQGGDATSSAAGSGGAGWLSTVPATATHYSGGGGAGQNNNTASPATAGSGGIGGGGNGGTTGAGSAGTANTGGGGGGGSSPANAAGAAGGSGVVVLRFSASLNITVSAGLTSSVTFSGGDEIVTITGGTGTVTFS